LPVIDFPESVSLVWCRSPDFGHIIVKHIAVYMLACWASFAQSADLLVNIGDAPVSGTLVFQIYDSPNSFGDFRNPAKEKRTPIQVDSVYRIDDVPTGDVAVLVYVDENDNGLIDKNFIGIPKEPLGISNNYRPKGPPAFSRARFTIADGEATQIDIDIYKVLGERGRLGVGAGVIGRSSPYVGSDTTVLQPIPAITYNGERLQWLGPEVQYGFLGTGRWRLAASASYRIGVYEEDDSPALAGLGDRESTLMAGLGLRYEIPGGVNMLLRYQHDALNRIGGGTGTARFSKGFQAGWFRFVPQLRVNWQSADVANYDFGVPESAATPTRPAYDTGSAVSFQAGFGSFIELTEDWRIILNLSAEFLPEEISNSPIVGEDRVVSGFAAITYVF
jgi:outer membrane protein